jgi:hypothetical protein
MGWHHHHHGDLELQEHFDIEDLDPMDLISDTIVVHDHEEDHSEMALKSLCRDSQCILRGQRIWEVG